MIVIGRHERDAVTQANVLGALRAGGEENFRRGGMRIFLEEVMFDFPSVIDAEAVCELDLVERVLEKLELVAVFPRPRQLVLVEDSEFHGARPSPFLTTDELSAFLADRLEAAYPLF